jgi:hypothetical protein
VITLQCNTEESDSLNLNGRKIEVVQGWAGEDYAQVIVIADGMAQIQSNRTHNAMALELCKAMRKV